jgi:hypothetical protein
VDVVHVRLLLRVGVRWHVVRVHGRVHVRVYISHMVHVEVGWVWHVCLRLLPRYRLAKSRCDALRLHFVRWEHRFQRQLFVEGMPTVIDSARVCLGLEVVVCVGHIAAGDSHVVCVIIIVMIIGKGEVHGVGVQLTRVLVALHTGFELINMIFNLVEVLTTLERVAVDE